jgi:hypothetical protein
VAALKCVYLQTILELNASIVVEKTPLQTKPTFQKRCFNCNDTGHIARDCPYDPICAYCRKGGHKKHDCDLCKVEQTRRDYGNYAPEIIVGQLFQEQDAQEETDKTSTLEITENESESTDRCVRHILLGAFNGKRLSVFGGNLINAQVSGGSFSNIEQVIDITRNKTGEIDNNVQINKVVISLGTNDVGRYKLDSVQVNVDVTTVITKVKNSFPNAQIGLCGTIPRKGTSNNYFKINKTAANVNRFIKMVCMKD